jgi:hypothetical protein
VGPGRHREKRQGGRVIGWPLCRGREKESKGGIDLTSRLEWQVSSVMGRNRLEWRLNMKMC